jgi:hypothetical protein
VWRGRRRRGWLARGRADAAAALKLRRRAAVGSGDSAGASGRSQRPGRGQRRRLGRGVRRRCGGGCGRGRGAAGALRVGGGDLPAARCARAGQREALSVQQPQRLGDQIAAAMPRAAAQSGDLAGADGSP